MRYLFRPPAPEGADLMGLPWEQPLEEWGPSLLLEVPQRGLSRHVVRFIARSGRVYALKELAEHLARREYALLGRFEDEGLPAVSVLGICVDRPHGQDAILVTRYLENSMSYRYLFSNPPGEPSAAQLLDILVILLVRLHLAGVYWGDCSLSNTLFPPDAGTYSAYFVDAETAEHHVALSPGQRRQDVDQARERVGGELLDLQSAESLPADFDPIGVADALPVRYTELWHEVTREEVFHRADQRYRIAERLRRLNDLGFDVGEVELVDLPGGGVKLRVDTRISPPETNRRELFRLTGLEVQEGQARRLLNDVRSFRAHLERQTGSSVSDTVAAQHWLTEVYQAVVDAIPPELSGRLAAAEVFHEVLEHRWFLSEDAGRDIGTTKAAASYFATVLPHVPEEVTSPSVTAGDQ